MQIYSDKGLFIGNIAVDPGRASLERPNILTHGHADHVSLNGGSSYICTPKTRAIVESRFGKINDCTELRFREKLSLGNATVSLHNSGHILGSAQVLVEGNQRVAVTSDFKMQDSLIQKGADALPCDILVIESTFGLPCFSFPEREQLYSEIGSWIKSQAEKGFVVLAGYSLGKAQELTAISNKYAGISPLVHESIFKNNEVYRQHGVSLGKYIELNHNLGESSVLIMPPSLLNNHLLQFLELSLKKKVSSALATGWAFRRGYDRLFPLSDHADFNQLMQYVKQAEPKLVLTMHGSERELASYIQRRLGIVAKPLGMHEQKTLTEFA
ncbi:MAG: hypothetical protein JW744_03670 [Candidatus Diapherotrites archaeon]|uniref:Zn-dependent metallo-hydrolase RNA specificity domain-containing protein n=1 Tax=Candidatus Iainarchaeum sp. TaxID=3101447 RepID=A0A938YRF9_9ARCH|nr:hypothetical protein [Candidatus Diapherotrites archaeon]